MKRWIIILFLLILFIGITNIDNKPEETLLHDQIQESIDRGVDFLYKNQLDYGEFKTYVCSDKLMKNCSFDSSPFLTTFVLYSIKDVKDERIKEIINESLHFLLDEQELNGAWNYHASRDLKNPPVPDDADDTACVSAALVMNNFSFKDNLYLFNKYKNEEGIVSVWFSEEEKYKEYDCEVNSNVLFYFSLLNIKDDPICDYINKKIFNKDYGCCIYCEKINNEINKAPLFYLVSRAYKHGATCFNESRQQIIEELLLLQKDDGSFGNDLNTALSLNTLMNFNFYGEEIGLGIGSLMRGQSADGSYEKDIAWIDGINNLFGSEELTTAIAIEALNKYIQATTLNS